jgi:hypothetical protein
LNAGSTGDSFWSWFETTDNSTPNLTITLQPNVNTGPQMGPPGFIPATPYFDPNLPTTMSVNSPRDDAFQQFLAAGGQMAGAGFQAASFIGVGLITDGAGDLAAGDHIVLGLEEYGLADTAAQVGGRTLMKDMEWQSTLQAAVGNSSTRITVSLDGVSGATPYSQFMNAAQQGVSRGVVDGNRFNWEMGQIYQAGRQGSVNFMKGGQVVPNPFH